VWFGFLLSLVFHPYVTLYLKMFVSLVMRVLLGTRAESNERVPRTSSAAGHMEVWGAGDPPRE
jgi:hypothetical protein